MNRSGMDRSLALILDADRDGLENMALDRSALVRAEQGQASLRIYSWERVTVSLGKSQRAEDVATTFPGLPTVGRPSGGGAVLHGFDQTIALAVPLAMLGIAPRALRETYVALVRPLAEALTACGLPCRLADGQDHGGAINCFASTGKVDLVHDESGKKVAGCALAATRGAALLHVSVPAKPLPSTLSVDQDTAETLTNPVWDASHFPHALAAGWRCEGFQVHLSALDARLDTWSRASAVLHQVFDPMGINGRIQPGFLREYDLDAQIFSTETLERILSRRGELAHGFADSQGDVENTLSLMKGFPPTPEATAANLATRLGANSR